MSTVNGPDFVAIQVRDLDRSAAFYEDELGLSRAAQSPPGVVAFETSTIPFGIREPFPGTDLDSGPIGLGVMVSFGADDARSLHDRLAGLGIPILTQPFETPFGWTFVFQDPDGYAIAVHG